MKNKNQSEINYQVHQAIRLNSEHDREQKLECFKKLGKHKKTTRSTWTQILDLPLLRSDCRVILERGSIFGGYDHCNYDAFYMIRIPVDFIFRPEEVLRFESCDYKGEDDFFVIEDEEIGMTFLVEADLCKLMPDEPSHLLFIH